MATTTNKLPPSYVPSWVIERKRMLTSDKIEKLLSLKPDEITKPVLLELFSRRATKVDKPDKVYEVGEPYMYPTNEFILPANTLKNQKETVLTTAGLYILNMHIIAPAFGEIVPYINETMDKGKKEDLTNLAAKLVLTKKIETDQFKLYHNRLTRLSTCAGFLVESLSENLFVPNPVVEKVKKELFEKYKDEIDKNNISVYVEKIENKLIEVAKQELKSDPSYIMMEKGGKPDIGNHYKNNLLTNGLLPDLINGGYVINKNSYNEGFDLSKFSTACNKLIYASYERGVKTQDGGAMTKYLYSLMQLVKHGAPGSDCHSEMYREVTITKGNKKNYLYRYIYEGKSSKNGGKAYTLLTLDNLDDYVNKKVKLRSPMYCKHPGNKICNVCLGEIYRMLEIENIGLTCTRASNSIMYIAMKAMHNITIKLYDLDIFKFIKEA